MTSNPTEADLSAAESRIGSALPEDYKAFLLRQNGRSWDSGSAFVQLYSLGELLDLLPVTAECQAESHPGLLYIGGDGGREGLGYDLRQAAPPLVLVEYTSSGWHEALFQAVNLTSFMQLIEDRGWDFDTPYSSP